MNTTDAGLRRILIAGAPSPPAGCNVPANSEAANACHHSAGIAKGYSHSNHRRGEYKKALSGSIIFEKRKRTTLTWISGGLRGRYTIQILILKGPAGMGLTSGQHKKVQLLPPGHCRCHQEES